MNTKEKFVITISREVGSGGRTIGRKLAEKLGVRFIDKQIIDGLIERFNMDAADIERIKGKKINWLTNFAAFVRPAPGPEVFLGHSVADSQITTNDEIFLTEREIIMAFAEESSCVVAGRSGFFVLQDHPNKLDVFIHASTEKRLERIMEKQGITQAEAEKVIEKVDKGRENFVKHFSGKSRYDLRNYSLSINMDSLTEDDAVDLILRFIGC